MSEKRVFAVPLLAVALLLITLFGFAAQPRPGAPVRANPR